ncbi:MAG: FGGY family carbohydrate kinase [Candidatus Limnocylindrales bacterium]|jgi:sugar (pentulose or hexulose) kinase
MAAPGEVLLAIDVGTSGARAVAFDLDGHRLFEVRRGYPIVTPAPGWAEQDARLWRSAALGALGEVVRRLASGGRTGAVPGPASGTGPRFRIRAIGLTGQCPSVVPVDRHGEPLGPGLMYRDNRATAEAAELRELFGDARIHSLTGHLPAAFHIAPKMLWLRRHRPEIWTRDPLFLQPRDLAVEALTGVVATDGTHAAATLLYDLRAGRWSAEMLAALGIDPGALPPIRRSAEVIGELRPALVRRFGLAGPVPVVLGGADSQACALGAGVVEPGPVSEMAGSSTCLNSVVPEPLEELLITHYPHVIPGTFTTETGINTTGAAVAWLADLLYGGRAGRASGNDYMALDAEAAAAPAGADGVLALPVLGDGERTDADLRAAFTGLSQRHGRAILARAMLEGVAFAIRSQLELLCRAGARVTELRVSGGDTRLATWNRIKADVTNLPVRPIPGDAATTGVAMLAGLGAGVYRNLDEAIARCVRPDPPIEPSSAPRATYDQAFGAYTELATSKVVRRQSNPSG